MSVLLLLLLSVASAAQLRLQADDTTLVQGQRVSVQLQVIDGSLAGAPSLPVGEGLRATYQGQSSSFSWVNGKSTRITAYDFSVSGLEEGVWTVGPVRVQSEAEVISSGEITLTVGARGEGDAAATGAGGVVGVLSDDRPWLGETVLYTLEYIHTDPLLDVRWSPPDYDGFVQERVAEAGQRRYDRIENGVTVGVLEIVQPLVAVGEGKRTVSPALVTGVFRAEESRRRRGRRDLFEDFGLTTNVREEQLSASALPIEIRPLPDAGRPDDFSGLVGQFSLDVRPSATQVALGESLTLDVRLVGTGTLAGFELPPPAEDPAYRAYDDEIEVQAQVRDGVFRAQARLKRAIVPAAEGILEVPGIALSVFDPEAEAYTTITSAPLKIEVVPGEAGASEVQRFGDGPTPTGNEVTAQGDDILPVPGAASVGDRSLQGVAPLAVGLVAAPGLLWLAVLAAGRRRPEDPWKPVHAALRGLPTDPTARLAALEGVFREAAGLRLSRAAPGLDESAISALGDVAVALYRDLVAARYGGAEVSDLEARVRSFVEGPR